MDVQFHNGKILHGDVLERLKEIPDESVDTEITSPPYWNLRDYSVEGQIGLEPDFRDYLKTMRQIMNELKRVLKKTGTCWINLGDTYSTKGNGVKEKSRMGIPERFYIQCIDDGWIARNHIPWYKTNAMPQSTKDRFSNKWESIFFFAKEKKYYFNLDAVREKATTTTKPFNIRVRENITGLAQKKLGDRAWTATEEEIQTHDKNGVKKQDNTLGADGKPIPTYAGFNERWQKNRKYTEDVSKQYTFSPDRIKQKRLDGEDHEVGLGNIGQGKNPGDVFFINPRPFPEAHFATFPPELPEKILKCACPTQVCKKCNKPRNPIVKPTDEYAEYKDQKNWHQEEYKNQAMEEGQGKLKKDGAITAQYLIVGWEDCGCNIGFKPGVVLDPFFGGGTVGLVAEQLNRKWIGIELSEEYVEMSKKRLAPYNSIRLDEFV